MMFARLLKYWILAEPVDGLHGWYETVSGILAEFSPDDKAPIVDEVKVQILNAYNAMMP